MVYACIYLNKQSAEYAGNLKILKKGGSMVHGAGLPKRGEGAGTFAILFFQG